MAPIDTDISIIKVSALVAAVTTIIVAIKKIAQFIIRLAELKDSFDENTRLVLKLIIMSEDMPLSERIKAGERYIELGGNGMVKCEYEKLLKEYKTLHGS